MTRELSSNQRLFTVAGFLGDLSIAFNFGDFGSLQLSDKACCFVVFWGGLLGVVSSFFLPYNYYMASRCVICAVSAYYFFCSRNSENTTNIPSYLNWGLLGCAILYNPVLPIHLGSQFPWIIINIATLALLYSVRQNSIFDFKK